MQDHQAWGPCLDVFPSGFRSMPPSASAESTPAPSIRSGLDPIIVVLAAMVIAVIAVRGAPILILPLVMVVIPAAARTAWAARGRRFRGEPMTFWMAWGTFATSLGLAFTAWCWPWALSVLVFVAGSFATGGVGWLLGLGDPPMKPAAYLALVAGLVAFASQAREFFRLDIPRPQTESPTR